LSCGHEDEREQAAGTVPAFEHQSVLLDETESFLRPGRGGLFVDCTLGLGGHAERLLRHPGVQIVGIDRDPQALEIAQRRLAGFGSRFRPCLGVFSDLSELLDRLGVASVTGLYADLGLSSMQIERPERGFSFQRDGPLDMRMGPQEMTANDIVNSYSEVSLQQIFSDFGQERQARRIAAAIVKARSQGAISTTRQLREIVVRAQRPRRPGRKRIDPATRVFQALRIEVNQELTALSQLLEQSVRRLESDGRIVIISYHSLEDRIVKNVFRDGQKGSVDPITGQSVAESQVLEVLTRKPVRPSDIEVAKNPRSRSARLRAARRL